MQKLSPPTHLPFNFLGSIIKGRDMEGSLLFCSGICLMFFLTAPYTSMHVFLVGHKKKNDLKSPCFTSHE